MYCDVRRLIVDAPEAERDNMALAMLSVSEICATSSDVSVDISSM